MLSVDEALRIVLDQAQRIQPAPRLVTQALGCTLAEPVVSDIDSPPHDKSVVDGYAIIAADVAAVGVELDILEEVTAGGMPARCVEPGTATRIMTGAPIPDGADAVVMIEQTETCGSRVCIGQANVKRGQNIMQRAASLARGQTVLEPGKHLRAIEIGLLAELGHTRVLIIRPQIAVLATGNELVDIFAVPQASQIRNSNGPMLAALAATAGAESIDLGIARDRTNDLSRAITDGLAYDVLLISGGVSAGVLDLVPRVLESLEIKQFFHKVNLKPGKPLWFGVKQHGNRKSLVFGLPGNPVSSLVCFELFVRPAIQKMRGLEPTGLARRKARLAFDHQQRGDRPTYWPAAICEDEVKPLAWKGSGDLRTLADANCLAFFVAGERRYRAGEEVELLLFDGT
jgi:molybdopterin molybdotransferase